MAIVRWNPGWSPLGFSGRASRNDLVVLRSQMMDMFDRFAVQSNPFAASRGSVFPPLNIGEDADNLYVTAELPGIPNGELELSVEADKLILRGERKIPEADKAASFHRKERESGVFRRVISLPIKVDADKVSAVSKNGVLDITLPKAADAKPRQIAIDAA